MKMYLNPVGDGSYTAEEIRQGIQWLHTDVKCTQCSKVQPLAVAGSIDNGKCCRCGGKTA